MLDSLSPLKVFSPVEIRKHSHEAIKNTVKNHCPIGLHLPH